MHNNGASSIKQEKEQNLFGYGKKKKKKKPEEENTQKSW